MHPPAVAVIQFPGVNCEFETARAVRGLGIRAEVVRWNIEEDLHRRFAGFVLPGGFSYQDRVRGGVIASREPVVESLREAVDRGCPVLGICNGAQILVEAGLVPGKKGAVETALAPNLNPRHSGYFCDWVHVRCEETVSFLARTMAVGDVFPLPVAHAEGRFVSRDENLFPSLLAQGQVPLRYCSPDGEPADQPPLCPNGAFLGAAAIANEAGNVVAMMPHPERAAHLHHVPDHIGGEWGRAKESLRGGDPSRLWEAGPGSRILQAFCEAVKEGAA